MQDPYKRSKEKGAVTRDLLLFRSLLHIKPPLRFKTQIPVSLSPSVFFNSLQHNLNFRRPWVRSFLKTLLEKKKMLVTNIFFFSHNVFYIFLNKFQFLCQSCFVICKCFQVGPIQNIDVEQRLKDISCRSLSHFYTGGRIDHAHHDSNAKRSLYDTLAFERAVARAAAMTSETDTLIVVSSDHSHVFTIGGYPTRGNPILGRSKFYLPLSVCLKSNEQEGHDGPGIAHLSLLNCNSKI